MTFDAAGQIYLVIGVVVTILMWYRIWAAKLQTRWLYYLAAAQSVVMWPMAVLFWLTEPMER